MTQIAKISYLVNSDYKDDVLLTYEFYDKHLILRIPVSNGDIIAEYYIPLKKLKEELKKV